LLTPYNISFQNKVYSFETIGSVKYAATFEEFHEIFWGDVWVCPVYSFSFFPIQDKLTSNKLDKRIAVTIKHLLYKFLKDSNSVLYYVCDTTDGKQRARDVLFTKWFKDFGHTEFQHLTDSFVLHDIEIHHGIMVESGNPHLAVIRERFLEY